MLFLDTPLSLFFISVRYIFRSFKILGQWFPVSGLWPSNISIMWELVRNTNSLGHTSSLLNQKLWWWRGRGGGSGAMGGLWSVFFTSPPGDWCPLVLRTTLLGCGHRVDCQCGAVFLSEGEHGIWSNRMCISVYDEMHEYLLFMWPGASH